MTWREGRGEVEGVEEGTEGEKGQGMTGGLLRLAG